VQIKTSLRGGEDLLYNNVFLIFLDLSSHGFDTGELTKIKQTKTTNGYPPFDRRYQHE